MWTVDSRQWTVDSGQWTVAQGSLAMMPAAVQPIRKFCVTIQVLCALKGAEAKIRRLLEQPASAGLPLSAAGLQPVAQMASLNRYNLSSQE